MIRELWARVPGALRDQIAGVSVSVVAFLLYAWFYFEVRAEIMPGNSDPHYIWLYARSLVFDHDFEFANDYRLCGDPFGVGIDHGTGHPANPYYLGPSLFLVPAGFLARLVTRLPANATPDVVGACRGAIAGRAIGVGCLVGALALYLSYRLARRWVSDASAAVSAAIFGWAGLLAAYSGMWPGYSHVYATFGVALVALTAVRASERPNSYLRWALAALAVAVGVLQRPPQLVWGLLPFVLALSSLRHDKRRLAIVLAILAAGAIAGVAPLLALYKYMYGSYTTSPVSGEYLHLGHAHPWLLLFAPHGGLFYTTPAAWLAVVGLWFVYRRRSTWLVLIPLLVAGLIEGYIYAAGLDWHGSGTFGARRLTALTPLFVVLAALALDRAAAWFEAKPKRALWALALAVILPITAVTQGAMLGQSKVTIDCCHGVSQADLYGEGAKMFWRLVDSKLGDVAVLPASLVFAARYRVSPNRWRDATEPEWYWRDFRSMRFRQQSMNLGDRKLVTDGIAPGGVGGRLVAGRARVVFAAEWPFATDLVVQAESERPARLKIGFGTLFGTTFIGEKAVTPGAREPLRFSIPKGAFDSGINELVLEQSGDAEIVVRDIRIEDANKY